MASELGIKGTTWYWPDPLVFGDPKECEAIKDGIRRHLERPRMAASCIKFPRRDRSGSPIRFLFRFGRDDKEFDDIAVGVEGA